MDALAGEYAAISPFVYVANNPIFLIDPDGNSIIDYYDHMGNYLGNDGQGTSGQRVISKKKYNEVINKVNSPAPNSDPRKVSLAPNPTDEMNAQRQMAKDLKNNSAEILIDENTINQHLQDAHDKTFTSGVEHSVTFVFELADPSKPKITSEVGPVGTNSFTTTASYSGGGQNPAWLTGVLRRYIGQAHGHPLTTTPGHQNGPGTSGDDQTAASRSGIPIYALRSWDRRVGSSTEIYRATPSGDAPTTPVGKTGAFNIALDALEISSGKRTK